MHEIYSILLHKGENMNKDILNLEEVAEYLRVSERTIYEWAKKGELPAGKIGNSWRFKREDIEKWVNSRLSAQKSLKPGQSVVLEEILSPDRIQFLKAETKEAALNELISVIAKASEVGSKDELQKEIFKREELMSTGIGNSIAIPHVRLSSISDLVGAVGLSKKGIADYLSFDDEPVRIIIMLVAGFDQHPKYLKALAGISARLKDRELREALLKARTNNDVYRMIAE